MHQLNEGNKKQCFIKIVLMNWNIDRVDVINVIKERYNNVFLIYSHNIT